MKIKVSLQVADAEPYTDVIALDDRKLEELSEEEIEAAIEIRIRTWADRLIRIEWETENEDQGTA